MHDAARVRQDVSRNVVTRGLVYGRSRSCLSPGMAASCMDLLNWWSNDRGREMPNRSYQPGYSPVVEHFGMVFDSGVWPVVRDGQGRALLAMKVPVPGGWSTEEEREF